MTPATPSQARKLLAPRETDPAAAYLASKYGPDFRAILGLKDHPCAETDDSAFYDFFGSEPFDAAPDLTAHSLALRDALAKLDETT